MISLTNNNSASSSPGDKETTTSAESEVSSATLDVEAITQQANMTIVIHPGSSHLRIGRASDPQPVMIPHVIAWRHKNPETQTAKRMKLIREDNKPDLKDLRKIEDMFFFTGCLESTADEVRKENSKKKPEKLQEGCGWTWTDTSLAPKFLIGDDALYIDEEDCYDLFWPIVNGQLNLKSKSITAVLADLQCLWTKAIENFLRIPVKDIGKYRCILVIPDIYNREHIKNLVNLLLDQMQFSAIIIHQESVCATYGCGVANACVVDVGHQKTAVCCVEDGFSHFNTRLCMDIGGCDITGVFAWILMQNNFPYKECNVENRMDFLLLEELKETFCHLDVDRIGPEPQEFSLRRPGQMSLLYPFTLGDEAMQAPISLFFPKLYGKQCQSLCIHFPTKNMGASDDPFDETYLASTRTKQEEAWAVKKEKAAAARIEEKIESNDRDEISMMTHKEKLGRKFSIPKEFIGLDDAIVWSIENSPDSYENELKSKMYSCILVVGGGLANFDGVEDYLRKRIEEKIPKSSKSLVGHVKVVTKPKGQDSSIISWKGGTVLSSLDNAQELWIKRNLWMEHGLRLLRENCAFIW
ncbi:unnamed protein product [Clavelina lepadiformis]|uniref:Actin-related protein 8 n=1 Tax=Clavelina lepadiformis TaxID=159417 RepID=A0ABP0GGH5_CLALP